MAFQPHLQKWRHQSLWVKHYTCTERFDSALTALHENAMQRLLTDAVEGGS
jgi:hypothetical protein